MDKPLSIGELARRTGLTVKTVRSYSERGIVTPARTASGHRRYGAEAVARLDLVRTLRELGLNLVTIERIVTREAVLPDVAAAHVQAIEVQIRLLRLRQAVLTAAATRGSSPEEMAVMHQFATLTGGERRALIADFLTAVFGGLDQSGFARSMTPELPDDPAADQLAAWLELAELSQDPDFRATLRSVAEQYASDLAAGPRRGPVEDSRDALDAGVDPDSPEAAEIIARHGAERTVACLAAVSDRRRERYFELLAVINGWEAPENLAPVSRWLSEAVRATA
ncbi:MerR family transcriptional regulator [Amycolatopsis benzoatilytica]|uniref:MerR family transcriptional regulator n=1 Tax=Amycolatopsis benzoatilytica TaxID=346045 RepID=UPI00036DBC51|nr:MerR family transcriptional regulator [Amycolatopsis benzoatilytica]